MTLTALSGATKRHLMTRLLLTGAGLIALALLATATTYAQAPARRTFDEVGGRVVQGTPGGPSPAGVEIRLSVVSEAGFSLRDLITTTDRDGGFRFEELPEHEAGDLYRVSLAYGGISRVFNLENVELPQEMRILVHQTTPALENVSVTEHSTIYDVHEEGPGELRVLELMQISNVGDRTFLPGVEEIAPDLPGAVRFALPEGYRALQVDSDLPSGSVVQSATGFAISNAVPPGEYQVMVSYALPYRGDSLDVVRPMYMGADEYRVMVPPDAGEIKGSALLRGEDRTVGGATYAVYRQAGVAKGDIVEFTIDGLPDPSLGDRIGDALSNSSWVIVGTPILAAAVMAILIGYAMFTRRRAPAAARDDDPDAHSPGMAPVDKGT